MLNEQERMFIDYWEANRLKEKKVMKQLLVGLPVGALFGIPIILMLISGRFWYKRADIEATSNLNPLVLIVAVVIIIIFVAIFYKRHQWDMKEQQYLELKSRQENERPNP
jgi:hypothetical protein